MGVFFSFWYDLNVNVCLLELVLEHVGACAKLLHGYVEAVGLRVHVRHHVEDGHRALGVGQHAVAAGRADFLRGAVLIQLAVAVRLGAWQKRYH